MRFETYQSACSVAASGDEKFEQSYPDKRAGEPQLPEVDQVHNLP